jgi:hypothetical protein
LDEDNRSVLSGPPAAGVVRPLAQVNAQLAAAGRLPFQFKTILQGILAPKIPFGSRDGSSRGFFSKSTSNVKENFQRRA